VATRRRLTWLDVFTSVPLAGNALAVIHDADGVDDATMQAVARETDLSETTFVQSPAADGADYRNRIFTTLAEIPFAGHPSLGTAVAVARARGESQARYVQETKAGLQPVEVELAGDVARASMLQEPAVFGDEMDAAEVLSAIGLEPTDAHPELPVQPVSTGINMMMVPVRDLAALGQARGQHARLHHVTRASETIVLYAFVPSDDGAARARGFFEAPGAAIEDPGTGAAAGPLCAYLSKHLGHGRVTIEQGVEMGRPSRIDVQVEGDTVRVSGDVVVVLEGEILLP
jgi:trans-2,3-dihydro-3-hydroxyanthranilate isomerase